MKKALSLVLAMLLVISILPTAFATSSGTEVWDGSIAKSFASGSGTEDDPYVIETASQLAYMASSNQTFSGKYVKLANDIYLNDTADWENWGTTAPANKWTPIGKNSGGFKGTFDGDNHTIYGIYSVGSDYEGLFHSAKGTSTESQYVIKNVTVKDSYINSINYAGGIAARCYIYGSIENCHNYATVYGNIVGGIVGYNYDNNWDDFEIIYCSNHGKVNGTTYAGGMVGSLKYSKILNCYNAGEISGSGDVGGIVGYLRSYCWLYNGSIRYYGYIENSYNCGKIVSDKNAGGICGNVYHQIYSSNGSYENYARNVYNVGEIEACEKVGQLVGSYSNYYDSVSGYLQGYYYNPVPTIQYAVGSSTKDTSSTISLTKPKALLQESYTTFDFENVWTMEGDSSYPYPKLINNMTHVHKYECDVTPSCTEDQLATYTCSCGDTYQETLKATGHTVVVDEAVAPNCTTDGKTEGSHCSVCDAVITEQTTVSALGHTPVTITGAPATCENSGLTDGSKCSVCDEVLTAQETIEALGHNYIAVVTAPTCTEAGYTTYTCAVCSDTYTLDETPATGHTVVIDEAVAPSCSSTGLTEGSHCSVCNEVFVEQTTVDALGHTTEEIPAVAPTCTTEGSTAGTKCSACGEILVASQVIAALGHTAGTPVVENVIDTTCSAAGSYDEVVYCTVCNTEISRITKTVDVLPHSYDNGVVTTAPTCTEAGVKTFTCSACGDTYTENIEKTDHNYTSVVTVPTCTANGYTTFTCACGDSYTANEVPATGHTVVIDNAVAPTCSATGLTEGSHCSVCNDVIVEQTVVETLAHTDDNDDGVCDTCSEQFCSCNCHKTGITKFFWSILNFFQKLFGNNATCACGKSH